MEIILEAIKQNVHKPLEYASETLKNDREFILAAANQKTDALEYASETLKNDREFVLEAVKQNGDVLQYVSNTLKNDREILLAIKQ